MYDAGGALAAEYSTATPTTTPTTSYMTTDHLGSPRVITDKNGAVISRRDFMPFGEEIYAGVGGRNTNQKYANFGSDNIRKRYTGYEKDDETQLDFAQARMYQNKHGRFTAVDPLMASASPGNPQTFNRYTYINNNPINDTDLSGLCPVGGCSPYSGNVYFKKVGDTTSYFAEGQCNDCTLYEGPDINFADKDSGVQTTVSSGGWVSQTQAEYEAGLVNISDSPAEELTTSAGEIGTTMNSRATEPNQDSSFMPSNGANSSIPDPPISSEGLDYSRSGQKIIDEHIDGNDMIQSQYIFTPYERLFDLKFRRVMSLNDITYRNGRGFSQTNGNTAYVYAFPDTEIHFPGLKVVTTTWVGQDVEMGNDTTNANTVVVGRDGKTVMTSHPGIPSYIDPNNPPKGVGTPVWTNKNWRRDNGIIVPWIPLKY